VHIRTATLKDASDIASVLRRSIEKLCFLDHRGRQDVLDSWQQNKTPENVAEWISAPDNFCITAISGQDRISGFGLLTRSGEILLLYVDPDFAGRGAGHALLERIEQQAVSWKLPKLTLESTVTARSFYENHGFLDARSAGPRQDGLSCQAMYKPLDT